MIVWISKYVATPLYFKLYEKATQYTKIGIVLYISYRSDGP